MTWQRKLTKGLLLRVTRRLLLVQHSTWAYFEERREYDLAEKAYRRAIDWGHSYSAAKARLNLGVLYEQMGEYDLAVEAYQQAINSRDPEVAPKGMRNLRELPMRSTVRESGGA